MNRPLQVREVSGYISMLISRDAILRNILVTGEVTNFKNGRYLYFDLQDDEALIHCVCFLKNRAFDLPKNGDKIIVYGSFSTYQKGGVYQLIVSKIEMVGLGDKLKELEELKKKLALEGLFDKSRKKLLPSFPKRIGIITSFNGAVIHDFGNEICRRYPLVKIVAANASVQGINAAKEIKNALIELSKIDIDIIVICRGGGSVEDLSPFNDEFLVREIANSKIPIVTAIGHQVDYTLSDLASDVRASTPTEAAVIVTPDKLELYRNIDEIGNSIFQYASSSLKTKRIKLNKIMVEIEKNGPFSLIFDYRDKLNKLNFEILNLSLKAISSKRSVLSDVITKIEKNNVKAITDSSWKLLSFDGVYISPEADLKESEEYELLSAKHSYVIKIIRRNK